MELEEGDYVLLPKEFCKENLKEEVALGRIWKWVEAGSNEVLVTYRNKKDVEWQDMLCHQFFNTEELIKATPEEYPELFL